MEEAASYIVNLATRLKPAAHGGFEDLVRRLYQAWTGRRAYLAAAGFQRGGDAGGATKNDQADCISCKRYSARSPSERDVLGEFEQAVLANPELDLWILAATSPVSKQVADSLGDVGQKDGVPVIIIDHDSVPLSRMVGFIVGQCEVAAEFFSEQIDDFDSDEFQRCIAIVKSAPDYGEYVDEIKNLINAPENGRAAFCTAVVEKQKSDFSNRRASMRRFGQALTPFEDGVEWIERPQYENELKRWYEGDEPAIVVTGEEMMGKSYLAARWLTEIAEKKNAPIPLFIPSKIVRSTDDAISLLARACVAAADTLLNEGWWRRRWARAIRGGGERVEAVVVIDGLNERSSIDWSTLVREFDDIAKTGVIKVIYTVRPRFWRDRLEGLKDLNIRKIEVRPYNDSELATALRHRNLEISDFLPALIQLLRTPGYFQLGVRLRDRLRNDISIYRLTWEEWRYRRERRDNISLTDEEFWTVVRRAAQDYPNKATLSFDEIQSLASFAKEAVQVREDLLDARVFEANGDLLPDYKVTQRFAALGLGAYLLQELEQAAAKGEDVCEGLDRALEPQADTDFKSEIVATALFLGVQKSATPSAVIDALTENLLRARNRPHEATLLLLFAIGHKPEHMIALAERHWAREGWHEAQDVITEAFLRKRDDEAARPAITVAFNRWMRFVHSYGGTLYISRPSEERAKEKRRAIERRVGFSLTAGAAEFRGEPIFIVEDKMLLRLRSMALHVISGGDTEPFVKAFRGWAAAGAAMHDWGPKDQVEWVLRTAPSDCWRFLASDAEELAASGDIDLQRAAYQLADAAGTEAAIAFKDRLPEDLFPVPEHAEAWTEYEKGKSDPSSGFYAPDDAELLEAMHNENIPPAKLAELLSKDALDPELNPPASFLKRLEDSVRRHGEALRWSGRFTTGEQIDFERVEPTLAAIAPDALKTIYNDAIQRMADAASSDRTLDKNAALGLAIHVGDCTPILNDTSREAIKRVHDLAAAALNAPDREQNARDNLLQIEHSLFGAIFPSMSAREQFEALVNRPPNAYLIRGYANAMKPLSADEIKDVLGALSELDSDTLSSALWFLSASPAYPDTKIAANTLLTLYRRVSITARGMLFRLFSVWRHNGLEAEAKTVLGAEDEPENKDQRAWLRHHAVAYLASMQEPVENYADLLGVDEFSRVVSRRRDDRVLREGLARSIEVRLKAILTLDENEAPVPPKNVSIELNSDADANGEAPTIMSVDANRDRKNSMTAANRGGETSVVESPVFEKEEEFEARVNAILKAVCRLQGDEKTSWWRSELSLSALRTVAEDSIERTAHWIEVMESAAGRANSTLWRISGFMSLLSVALMPKEPALALRVQRLARKQDKFGRINFICAGTILPLEMVELFTAPETDDVIQERRALIDKATSDADLAIIAGCAMRANADSWLLEEVNRRLRADSLLARGKGLMLAALLGVPQNEFGILIEISQARQTWLNSSLDDLERLCKRTHWVRRRVADTQTCRGEQAYFVLRAARPSMHAALQAYIDDALIENEEWKSLESSLDILKRDAEKTQKDWEKHLLCKKIDHRIIRISV